MDRQPQEGAAPRRTGVPPVGLVTLLESMAAAGEGERVALGDVAKSMGPAGPAGVLLIPALIAVSPASALLGMATLTGLTIAFVALQIMAGVRQLWLPGWFYRIRVPRSALAWTRDRLSPPLAWIERRSRPRLTLLMRWPLGHLPGLSTFLVGLGMPFLEFVPMSATTGGAAVVLMTVGLILDDGLLVVLGLAMAAMVGLLIFGIGSGAVGLLI
ncbi:exopolysaccharide biosynthesis protein [Jannaschia seohaensis]|uniref:Uncharacterized conserved protein n=1 Tax=Jannaschia seohaensis TaxID=475081 RepID=A0A2Y9AQD7_9RHOB|nr:exopolysaccharide biosynthesis protein [Jannaschia seohaensis]PWJ18166.1 hypothetical protein BCF38_105154 [Jannaschia seohaensis]SSA46691.1 Uncharacterized conserved protein [Jannaschia seohaensis]